jgi:deoxyribonuclease V
MVEGDLAEEMIKNLFPRLDMNAWISQVIENIPAGIVITFGQVAECLGTKWASRAVGERISKIDGPTHRIVYSDGRVPPGSVEELSDEFKLKKAGNMHYIKEFSNGVIETKIKPLEILSELQNKMKVLLREDEDPQVGSIAGLDISSKDELHIAGLSCMDLIGDPIDDLCYRGTPGLPYIPGLLFYREAPLLLPLLRTAKDKGIIDDVTLCVLDGNGTLHPRRMGIACQIGASSGNMTCGVAKKLLMGSVEEPFETENGLFISDVCDNGEIIGSALSGKDRSKPVYISRGHRIDQRTVNRIISDLRWTRIPEPTKRAHALCNKARLSETPS